MSLIESPWYSDDLYENIFLYPDTFWSLLLMVFCMKSLFLLLLAMPMHCNANALQCWAPMVLYDNHPKVCQARPGQGLHLLRTCCITNGATKAK